MASVESTARSGMPNWLKKLRTRENLGGRRRDADQIRLLDLAAEAASQAAFHGKSSAALGVMDAPGSVIETMGTDLSPTKPQYDDPKQYVVKDQLMNELSTFLGRAGGAGANVRQQLRKVSEEDKKSWFLREADRLRLQQIKRRDRTVATHARARARNHNLTRPCLCPSCRHDGRLDAIARLEQAKAMQLEAQKSGGSSVFSQSSSHTPARRKPSVGGSMPHVTAAGTPMVFAPQQDRSFEA